MDTNAYETEVSRTAQLGNSSVAQLTNFALGLAGETGEVVELIKKHVFHGCGLSRDALVKEAGDCVWYLTALCLTSGISLAEVMQTNVDKLRARYPNGFVPGGGIREEK